MFHSQSKGSFFVNLIYLFVKTIKIIQWDRFRSEINPCPHLVSSLPTNNNLSPLPWKMIINKKAFSAIFFPSLDLRYGFLQIQEMKKNSGFILNHLLVGSHIRNHFMFHICVVRNSYVAESKDYRGLYFNCREAVGLPLIFSNAKYIEMRILIVLNDIYRQEYLLALYPSI